MMVYNDLFHTRCAFHHFLYLYCFPLFRVNLGFLNKRTEHFCPLSPTCHSADCVLIWAVWVFSFLFHLLHTMWSTKGLGDNNQRSASNSRVFFWTVGSAKVNTSVCMKVVSSTPATSRCCGAAAAVYRTGSDPAWYPGGFLPRNFDAEIRVCAFIATCHK